MNKERKERGKEGKKRERKEGGREGGGQREKGKKKEVGKDVEKSEPPMHGWLLDGLQCRPWKSWREAVPLPPEAKPFHPAVTTARPFCNE